MGGEELPLLGEVEAKEERRLEGEELRRKGAMAEKSNKTRVQAMEVSKVACSLEIFVTKCILPKMLWRKQKKFLCRKAPAQEFLLLCCSWRPHPTPPRLMRMCMEWRVAAPQRPPWLLSLTVAGPCLRAQIGCVR